MKSDALHDPMRTCDMKSMIFCIFNYYYVILIEQLSETLGIGMVVPKCRESAKTLYGLYKIKK